MKASKRDRYLIIHNGIARWKIDTPFENWLSYRADNSEFWKRIYVLLYKLFDRKYYNRGLKFIDEKLELYKNEWRGLNRKTIIRDMVYSLHRFGADFQDYWSYDFLNLSAVGREKYVVDKLRYGYDDILTTPQIVDLASDKYACYKKFKSFYKREALGCYCIEDEYKFIDFAKKHKSFIVKPLSADCGKGVHIVKELCETRYKDFFATVINNGPFIAEEIITQHEKLASLHPESINTVRIATFTYRNNVSILAASVRIGVGNSATDNAGSGGIFASIDTLSGIVISKATNYQKQIFTQHPDTHIAIPGFIIPCWRELIEIVNKAALEISDEKPVLISWDFALSTSGWIIVEVNTGGDWIILQAAQKEPLKEKLYQHINFAYETR